MKRILLSFILLFSVFGVFAQRSLYGKLEALKSDDTVMVLRTNKDSLDKLKRTGIGYTIASRIESVEESLNIDRALYLHLKPKGFYESQLPGIIGMFQRDGFPGVQYYIKEYLIYHPDYSKDHK